MGTSDPGTQNKIETNFITSTLTDQFEKSYTDTKHLDKSSEVGLQKHVVWENACFGRFHRYGMLRNWCLIFYIKYLERDESSWVTQLEAN